MSPAHPRVVAVMLLAAPFVPLTSHVAVRSTAHSWKCPRAPAALRGGTDRMLDHRQISWPSEEENEDRPCTLDEESRLDLRRELLLRARATDVLLRLNHDPNSVSPPVV